jgi:transcriptional regulator with XRE-family HTH domain
MTKHIKHSKRRRTVKYADFGDIGKLLERCRTERNLRQLDVAEATGLSDMAISLIERGERKRGLRTTRNKLEEFLRKYNYIPKVA